MTQDADQNRETVDPAATRKPHDPYAGHGDYAELYGGGRRGTDDERRDSPASQTGDLGRRALELALKLVLGVATLVGAVYLAKAIGERMTYASLVEWVLRIANAVVVGLIVLALIVVVVKMLRWFRN